VFLQPLSFLIFIPPASRKPTARRSISRSGAGAGSPDITTEYSSMSFAMFFLAEYINMVTVSAVAADLFLGRLARTVVCRSRPGGSVPAQVSVLLFCYIWMRWTLPRYRYDQLMAFGWKVLLRSRDQPAGDGRLESSILASEALAFYLFGAIAIVASHARHRAAQPLSTAAAADCVVRRAVRPLHPARRPFVAVIQSHRLRGAIMVLFSSSSNAAERAA